MPLWELEARSTEYTEMGQLAMREEADALAYRQAEQERDAAWRRRVHGG